MKLSNYSLNYSRAIATGALTIDDFLAICRALRSGRSEPALARPPRPQAGDPGKGPSVSAGPRAVPGDVHRLAPTSACPRRGRRASWPRRARRSRRRRSWERRCCGSSPDRAPRPIDRPAGRGRSRRSARCVSKPPKKGCRSASRTTTTAPTARPVPTCSGSSRRSIIPNLVVVLDCGQFLGSQGASGAAADKAGADDLYESIRLTAPLARHVRVKFYHPRPDGSEPFIDYPRVLDILRSVHYNSFLDIVYEPDKAGGEEIKTAVPRIVGFLRSQTQIDRTGHAAGTASAPANDRYAEIETGTYLLDRDVKTETALAFLEGPTVDRRGHGLLHQHALRADPELDPIAASARVGPREERRGQWPDPRPRGAAPGVRGRCRPRHPDGPGQRRGDGPGRRVPGPSPGRSQRPGHRRQGPDLLHLAAGQPRSPRRAMSTPSTGSTPTDHSPESWPRHRSTNPTDSRSRPTTRLST